MAEMLEATRKTIKYFKRSLKHNPSHPNKSSNHQSNISTSHSDKHKHKYHYHKDKVNESITNTHTPNHIATGTDKIQENTDS